MRAALLLLAACGSGVVVPQGTPDAGPDAGFHLRVDVLAVGDAGATINGAVADRYEVSLDREQVVTLTIATRGGVWHAVEDCDDDCRPGDWSDRHEAWCAFESGELRFGGAECAGDRGCATDGACRPRCQPGQPCGDGDRCGVRHRGGGWLDCVAVGARGLRDSCTIDGFGVDDCGDGLDCVGGRCLPMCPCATGTCAPVPGASPEVGLCR